MVGVADGVSVCDGVCVGDKPMVGVLVGVTDGVLVSVAVAVCEGVAVCVLDGVIAGVLVIVGVTDGVGVIGTGSQSKYIPSRFSLTMLSVRLLAYELKNPPTKINPSGNCKRCCIESSVVGEVKSPLNHVASKVPSLFILVT